MFRVWGLGFGVLGLGASKNHVSKGQDRDLPHTSQYPCRMLMLTVCPFGGTYSLMQSSQGSVVSYLGVGCSIAGKSRNKMNMVGMILRGRRRTITTNQ